MSLTMLQLPQIIAAVGALGVAAFGLVDATKVIDGGVNRIGFKFIRIRVATYLVSSTKNALSVDEVIETLRQNWFNGTDLASQKAIAKSLIKLSFNADTAPTMAAAAQVDIEVLKEVATSIATGSPLTASQSDVYARFDLILTAQLDGTYQHADQSYRNATRGWALVFSIILAIVGMGIITNWAFDSGAFWEAFVVGLIATPIAPMAKDLSTALATAVNTLQLVKKS